MASLGESLMPLAVIYRISGSPFRGEMEEGPSVFELDAKKRESFRRELNRAVESALRSRYPETPLLTETQWKRALAEVAEWGGFLQDAVMELGFLGWETLLAELSYAWKVPTCPLMEETVDFESTRAIGEKFCRENWVVAVKGNWVSNLGAIPEKPDVLSIAMPLLAGGESLFIRDDLSLRMALPVRAYLSLPSNIEYWLREAFPELRCQTGKSGALTKRQVLDAAYEHYEAGRRKEALEFLRPLLPCGDTAVRNLQRLLGYDIHGSRGGEV